MTALLHNALASDPADPHFAPEYPSTEALGAPLGSIDEEIEYVFASLPDIAALEQVAAAARRCATTCACSQHRRTSAG